MRLRIDLSELELAIRLMGAKPATLAPGPRLDPRDPIDLSLAGGLELPDLIGLDRVDGLLSYKGRQVLLYIQDHGRRVVAALEDAERGNKFHVADCRTLEQMRAQGRFERYVVMNRLDGIFDIGGMDPETRQAVTGTARLRVCINCLNRLNYKGAREGRGRQLAEAFDIGEFFRTYASFFPHLPRRIAGRPEEEGYTPDWTAISGRHKVAADFTCQRCRVRLHDHMRLLQTHHRNGVKSDNSPENLEVLCVSCHREQPLHGHMFVPHQDTRLITRLRREQGLLDQGGWDRALRFVDPGLYGVLAACHGSRMPPPEIGFDVTDSGGNIVGTLELAWPRRRTGVAISEDDRNAALEQDWSVFRVGELLENPEILLG